MMKFGRHAVLTKRFDLNRSMDATIPTPTFEKSPVITKVLPNHVISQSIP
jgi:hypothetical protein